MNLTERDQKTIWHPYTRQHNADLPIAIVRGKGALLYDENGKSYIDAISSWWVNLHGHSHPYIAQKISEQLQVLEHVIFAGFTHSPAVELAERLLKILPQNQSKIFFSDDGSTAVEAGVKMALQYWFNQGIKKNRIVAFHNAYHGDTFGAMSVSSRSAFTAPFNELLFDVVHIDAPVAGIEEESAKQLEQILQEKNVAAFIFEPLIQGAGGMIVHSAEGLNTLLHIAQSNNVLTIADEVMTGFGRAGKYFASDYLNHKPDIICLSKGITGGVMPLGVTSCSQQVYEAFLSDDRTKTFFHGHSYTANPIACTAALASLDLLGQENCWEAIKHIQGRHKSFLSIIENHPRVQNCRSVGTIAAFNVTSSEQTSYLNSLRDTIYNFCINRGVIIRPLGNVVYIMPPYCITDNELNIVYSTLTAMLDKITNG